MINPPHPQLSQTRDLIEQEAQAIWHITELLGKVGVLDEEDSDKVTLSTASLHHFAGEISHRLTNLMEQVDEGFPVGK